jgi:hypothetical protein
LAVVNVENSTNAAYIGNYVVEVFTFQTHGYLGQGVTLAASAGGGASQSLDLAATDNTTITNGAGGLGAALGAAGLGFGLDVEIVGKDTEAYVGQDATVDAAAGGPNTLDEIYKDEDTGTGALTKASVQGLAVQATSGEDFFTIAIASSFGFYAGIAGGVTAEIIGSNTTADIGPGAVIDRNIPTTGNTSSVYVAAYNDAEVNSTGGAAAAGIAGIGGGVDVGVFRNNTSAYIGKGAEVDATGDVDVAALSTKNVQTQAVSAEGGIAALAGSISVWSIGADFTSTYSDGTQVTNRGTWKPQTSYNVDDLVTGSDGKT